MKSPKTDLENLLFTTVRIQTNTQNDGVSFGTGFLVSYNLENDSKGIFLVTNKHVIENGINWEILFNVSDCKPPRDNPIIGQHFSADIGNASDIWIKHNKYDIAILYFNGIYKILERNKRTPFIRTINYNKIPNLTDIENKIDAIEDVLIIGYPNAMHDPKSLIPIVRRGITATPYSIDFQDEPKFLIDASIFPGSSGSPVFIYDRTKHYDRSNTEGRIYLLGIVAETYFRTDSNEIIERKIPTDLNFIVNTHQMIDLGMVYKSSIIKNMIDEVIKSGEIYP